MQLNIQKNSTAGFTLIELTIVILIVAVISLPLFNIYEGYIRAQKRQVTIERIDNIASQIRIFRPSTFSYPCPADRALSKDDAMFGFEDCAAFAALAINTCTANGGICRMSGSRDTDTPADGMNNDSVLIGAVPFRSLDSITKGGIAVDGSLDGWNNKITYAVSARTTSYQPGRNSISVGNDFKYGVISALDEFGNTTAGIGMFDLDNADGDGNVTTGKDGDAQFALVSHGRTAKGAFNLHGVNTYACDTTTIDGENCDNDSVFRSALGDYGSNSASFSDDISYFFRDQTGDLWGYIENPAGGATAHIRKLNAGRVGVKTGSAAVTTTLEVNGTIKAPTTLTEEICKTNGTNCIPTRFLYDTYSSNTTLPTTSDPAKQWKNTCGTYPDGTGQAMTSITSGQANCASSVNIPVPPGGVDVDCPAGTYVQGVTTKGCIICTDGLIYPSAAACN